MLGEEATDLTADRCSSADEPIAHAVDGLELELLAGLDRHEAHAQPRDRLGIGEFVLLLADIWLRILRRHQPRVMPHLRKRATDLLRAGTRLHADEAGCQVAEKGEDLGPGTPPALHDPPVPVHTDQVKDVLPKVDPDDANPGPGWLPPLWLVSRASIRTEAGGAVHPITTWQSPMAPGPRLRPGPSRIPPRPSRPGARPCGRTRTRPPLRHRAPQPALRPRDRAGSGPRRACRRG